MNDIEDIKLEPGDDIFPGTILPVIYQPAADYMKNFTRVIHCTPYITGDRYCEVEVSIIFNNEQLRKHSFFNNFYEIKDLEQDSIHGDSVKPAPEHDVKYYFIQKEHPVVFINTSNHSMAENDSNHSLWKWEYVP
ncbi:hypothetical protein [Methanosarcina sp. WWM596]|uniref:hypothetical protein n=1 Tax=Methanosarcina sp. WWM596 TaxID=1434103 RepID=UPI000615A396|nr:hypothetical protein [Methanosarcina sp. WWM596]AKB18680.1 hypothetical protein MSWHS_1817 [Methanosarcina sp. WWM596]